MIQDHDGSIKIVWSVVNQTWFVMWGDYEVLRIFNELAEAEEYVRIDLGCVGA